MPASVSPIRHTALVEKTNVPPVAKRISSPKPLGLTATSKRPRHHHHHHHKRSRSTKLLSVPAKSSPTLPSVDLSFALPSFASDEKVLPMDIEDVDINTISFASLVEPHVQEVSQASPPLPAKGVPVPLLAASTPLRIGFGRGSPVDIGRGSPTPAIRGVGRGAPPVSRPPTPMPAACNVNGRRRVSTSPPSSSPVRGHKRVRLNSLPPSVAVHQQKVLDVTRIRLSSVPEDVNDDDDDVILFRMDVDSSSSPCSPPPSPTLPQSPHEIYLQQSNLLAERVRQRYPTMANGSFLQQPDPARIRRAIATLLFDQGNTFPPTRPSKRVTGGMVKKRSRLSEVCWPLNDEEA